MNADGSGVRVVFKKPGWVALRAWSADGKDPSRPSLRRGWHELDLHGVDPSGEARQLLPKTADRP